MVPRRHNKKWTNDEVQTLQREYELLELSVEEIADAHERTCFSILHKLEKEGIIDRWENARGWKACIKEFQTYVSYDYENEDDITTSEDFDDNETISKQVIGVDFLPEEREKDDTYNLEVNGVRTAIIHFLYFLASTIECISSYFQKKRFYF
jgi:CCR4-NOT transcriptional regulation complex NOT5 subunit